MMARSARLKRDWTSIREWTNLAVAIGVLLVAIVSVWTTTQISGLEDYFRSEIARRNSDLNTLADQGRRLSGLADEREKQLADLQTTTEKVTASSMEAQGRLLATQQELSRLGIEVVSAKQTIAGSEARLSSLAAQSARQVSLIDLFRRQRFFERAYMRVVFAGIRFDQQKEPYDGETMYRLITNWTPGELDPELAVYLPEFRSNAMGTCEWIRSYKPTIAQRQSYPDAPTMPGKRTADGDSVRMTQREYRDWIAARDDWNKRFGEVSAANDRSMKSAQVARENLNKAATSCICQALGTAQNSPGAICQGYEKPPTRPES